MLLFSFHFRLQSDIGDHHNHLCELELPQPPDPFYAGLDSAGLSADPAEIHRHAATEETREEEALPAGKPTGSGHSQVIIKVQRSKQLETSLSTVRPEGGLDGRRPGGTDWTSRSSGGPISRLWCHLFGQQLRIFFLPRKC